MSNGESSETYSVVDAIVDLSEVDTTPLDIDDDLYDVLKEVLPVAAKWKAVGQALRLKSGELDSIAASHPRNPEACLSEILTQWLRKNYNVKKFGEPTWRRLVEAVADPPGGANPALANQIAEKHRLKGKMKGAAVVQRRHSFSHRGQPMVLDTGPDDYQDGCEPDDLVQDFMTMGMSKSQMRFSWYYGKISRQDAREKLENAPDGYFLIRESVSQPDSFALSLKHQGRVIHRIIQFNDDSYTYEMKGTRKRFQKITELVKYYTANYISTQGEILITPCPQNVQSHPVFQSAKWDSEDSPPPPPVPVEHCSIPSILQPSPPHCPAVNTAAVALNLQPSFKSMTQEEMPTEPTGMGSVEAKQPVQQLLAQPASPTQDSSPSSTPTPPQKSSPPSVQNNSVMTHTHAQAHLPPPNTEPVFNQKTGPSMQSKPSSRSISPLTPTEQSPSSATTSLQPLQRKRTFQYCPSPEQTTAVKTKTGAARGSCTVAGEGIKTAVVQSAASFMLYIPASLTATNCTVTSEMIRVLDRSITECTITENGEREYEISYKPHVRGRHELSVKVGTHEIQGSPFTVFVRYPVLMLNLPVKTIPGPGASLPQLSQPLGLAFSPMQSQIIVCESGEKRISVLSREGCKIQEIYLKGPPHGVAIDKDEYSYVTIPKLHQIQKLSKDGIVVKAVGGLEASVLKKPRGIGVSPSNGSLYVCDSGNSRVQILDTQLNFVSSFGQKGRVPGSLMSPVDIAFDKIGHIYVADSDRNRIVQFSPLNHKYVKEFGKEKRAGYKLKLNCPQGICVGLNSDVVYVTDSDHCVSVFQTSGNLISTFGGHGQVAGQFQCPTGIAVDEDGYVYVCDRDNNRIQVF